MSAENLDKLIAAGQILFFAGSLIFAGFALNTQAKIKDYRNELRENGCAAVVPDSSSQGFEINTSTTSSGSNSSSLTTSAGT